jgi:hypothetical protein
MRKFGFVAIMATVGVATMFAAVSFLPEADIGSVATPEALAAAQVPGVTASMAVAKSSGLALAIFAPSFGAAQQAGASSLELASIAAEACRAPAIGADRPFEAGALGAPILISPAALAAGRSEVRAPLRA